MKKSALPKLAGIILGSFIVILGITFFLYPWLNEEKYNQVQTERDERDIPEGDNPYVATDDPDAVPVDSNLVTNVNFTDANADADADSDTEGSENSNSESDRSQLDLLMAENDSLSAELEGVRESLTNLENVLTEAGTDPEQIAAAMSGEGNADMFRASAAEQAEDFSDRVKSLLNLDEEDLEPIANQMSQEELVRIYQNSGNMQREKLLRSLTSERAAKLMKEVML
ncbi:MAG: hypothetical protein R6V27_03540 [Balneolaceae bacterium]